MCTNRTYLFELLLSNRVEVFIDDDGIVDDIKFQFERIENFDASAFLLAYQGSDDLHRLSLLSSLSCPVLRNVHDDEGVNGHAHASLG